MGLYGVNLTLLAWILWGHQHGQRVTEVHPWVYPLGFACAVGIALYHVTPKQKSGR